MAYLTAAQRRKFEPLQTRWWFDVGLCTEPADAKAAKAAVVEAYDAADLAPPRLVQWVRSPQEARRFIAKKSRHLGISAWFPVLDQVRKNVVRRIVENIGHALFAEIEELFRWSLFSQIQRLVGGVSRLDELRRSHGCHGAESFGALDYCQRVLGVETVAPMRGIMRVAEVAGWWWPFDDACIITDRPNRLELDMQANLHCEDGPALSFRDGSAIYAWHGVRVPAKLILRPGEITVREIGQMRNAEVRRCAIERYGAGRFIADTKAQEVHADDFGTLYSIRFGRSEPMVMVKVLNATPEPDGSFKDYFLRVPPEMETAREAVAWTFGVESEEAYAPNIQT